MATMAHISTNEGGVVMGLPQLIDPVECLTQEKQFQGTLASRQLLRLAELLEEATDSIEFALSFRKDEHGYCIVQCRVKASLPMQCQRCGQIMELPVDTATDLCVVASGKLAKKLPAQYEPLVTENAPVALLDIIEEELLLAIPMVPRHVDDSCSSSSNVAAV